MSEPAKTPFDLLVDQIRAAVREEVKAALADRPKQLLYDYDEAAEILNIPSSWLSERVRKKAIPHRKLGHYVRFAPADLEKIAVMAHPECVESPKKFKSA